jgi:nicotinate-nucleotide pyrophosphorylase (carboxylating)
MRVLEKWAVLTGGGQNHRMGLFDMIMIKDNHIDFAGGIIPAVNRVVEYLDKNKLDLKIEVEARSLNDVKTILTLEKVDRIMCDNFSIAEVKEAVHLINGQKETEASGGITEETLRDYALAGVDYISVGALTHQINSVDLSLKAIIQ